MIPLVNIKSKSTVVCHAINKDGNLLAYSDLNETKILLLKNLSHLEKANIDSQSIRACRSLIFGSQSDLLYMNVDQEILSYDIITDNYNRIADFRGRGVSFNLIQ